mmetsp:Transcript_54944/g.129017  ORF Transcript_54944/g.129017 Transcript_54944/m.129017 type:complete len:83 (-) Transcript_54944:41-289(-)
MVSRKPVHNIYMNFACIGSGTVRSQIASIDFFEVIPEFIVRNFCVFTLCEIYLTANKRLEVRQEFRIFLRIQYQARYSAKGR